ncbi:MAG: serine/threonine protein kinase [Labilithrix sp.]|nr:serine/threonine protein kinase [Labilithrix sp.]MCW5813625.1 serine/threonine protein kinase [Labilithrix sp.]
MQGGRGKTPRSIPPPAKTERMLGAPALPTEPQVRPPPNTKPGAFIGDKYRIEREIGRGGFGVVVRAMHLTLDQRVAIKVLTESEGSTEQEWQEDAARFRREAKATAALRSEHVVRVLDVDVLEHGYPYIVMEYLEGKTLHEQIYGSSGGMPVADAVDIVVQVLAAVADAHAVGIVHRDLKPANVFLTHGAGGIPIVKVLDFGVSKMLNAQSQRLTRTGSVVGTVAYMAPEQMLDARTVDGRGDLWSVGLILYEALARAHPFGPATTGPKVINAILKDPLVPIATIRADVPAGLDQVVSKLLEKKADQRYQTAIEAAAALAPFASPRVRPVLDEIHRSPPPSGAALSVPALTDSRALPPSSRSLKAAKKPRSSVARFFIVFITATITLGLIVFGAFWLKPRYWPKR